MEFKLLNWDSDFFNFKVARIIAEDISEDILDDLNINNVTLAYFASGTELISIENDLYEIKLVDKKVTYLKQVVKKKLETSIVPYTLNYPDESLIALAIRSGMYSRFYTDEKIGKEKFEELYKQWIINAVENKMGYKVLVTYLNNKLAGFVTVGRKDDRADIGLVAVGENFGRQGLGKALLDAAEKQVEGEYKQIQVLTQSINLAACRLYESCGYVREKTEFFYHLWKK